MWGGVDGIKRRGGRGILLSVGLCFGVFDTRCSVLILFDVQCLLLSFIYVVFFLHFL